LERCSPPAPEGSRSSDTDRCGDGELRSAPDESSAAGAGATGAGAGAAGATGAGASAARATGVSAVAGMATACAAASGLRNSNGRAAGAAATGRSPAVAPVTSGSVPLAAPSVADRDALLRLVPRPSSTGRSVPAAPGAGAAAGGSRASTVGFPSLASGCRVVP
jgi:hypothetical protein